MEPAVVALAIKAARKLRANPVSPNHDRGQRQSGGWPDRAGTRMDRRKREADFREDKIGDADADSSTA